MSKISNAEYKRVLQDLIVQGMIKLLEDEVIVRCREEDKDYIESILPQCEKRFSEFMLSQTEREYTTKLVIDDRLNLTAENGG